MTQTQSFLYSRRRLLTLASTGAIVTLAGCSTTTVLKPASGTGSDQTAVALPTINELRARNGLSALTVDPQAVQAALEQAARMAKVNKMAHLIGFNDDFAARMKRNGVALPAAENIAEGQQETSRAMDAWIHSPKHLKNMLGSYRGLGVAVVRDPASANRPFWSMVLSG